MTITPRQAAIRIDAIHQIVGDLHNDAPRAIHAIQAQKHAINLGAAPDVAVTASRGDSLVERSLGNIENLDDKINDIEEHITALAQVCGDLIEIVRPWAPSMTEAERRAMRCSGGAGLAGAHEWGNENCSRWKTRNDGMCDACRMRQSRWRNRPLDQTA